MLPQLNCAGKQLIWRHLCCASHANMVCRVEKIISLSTAITHYFVTFVLFLQMYSAMHTPLFLPLMFFPSPYVLFLSSLSLHVCTRTERVTACLVLCDADSFPGYSLRSQRQSNIVLTPERSSLCQLSRKEAILRGFVLHLRQISSWVKLRRQRERRQIIWKREHKNVRHPRGRV